LGVAFAGRHLMHYWWALVLLGIGWNFMYLGGTALLTRTYEANERFKVQACNDFVVFAMQAVAALSSGFLLFSFGWSWLVYLSAGVLIVPLTLVGYKQLALKGLKA
jgi:MFS family permease